MGIALNYVTSVSEGERVMAGVEDGIEGHRWTDEVQEALIHGSEPIHQLNAFCDRLRQSRGAGKSLEDVMQDTLRNHKPALAPSDLPEDFKDYALEENFDLVPCGKQSQWARLVRVLLIPRTMTDVLQEDYFQEDYNRNIVCKAIWQIPLWSKEIPRKASVNYASEDSSSSDVLSGQESGWSGYESQIEQEMQKHSKIMQGHRDAMDQEADRHQLTMSNLTESLYSCIADSEIERSLTEKTAQMSTRDGLSDAPSGSSQKLFFKRTGP